MKSIDVYDIPKPETKTATVEVHFQNISWFPGIDGDEWLPIAAFFLVFFIHIQNIFLLRN